MFGEEDDSLECDGVGERDAAEIGECDNVSLILLFIREMNGRDERMRGE